MTDGGTDAGFTPDAGSDCINIRIENRSEVFCTVMEAVEMANANERIILPATRIYEHILILDENKPLTITASTMGTEKTRIIVQDDQSAIQIGAAGTVIENLEIEAPNAAAVRVASSATLKSIHVRSAHVVGIVVTGGTDTTVLLTAPVIDGVTVGSGDVNNGAGAGIHLTQGVTVTINGGEIKRCAGSGVYADSATLTMFDTTLKQNNRGLEAVNPGGQMQPLVTLTQVKFLENQHSGLYVTDSRIVVSTCTAISNGQARAGDAHGFYLGKGTEADIQGNSCQLNVSHGIFCETGVIPNRCESNSYGSSGQMVGTNCSGC